jgi:hypothetical protein
VAVIGVRVVAAILHLGFTLPLVARLGPAGAGRVVGAVSAIELASLVGRLGVPVELARWRRLRVDPGPAGGRHLPTGPILAGAAASAVGAAAIGALVDLPVPVLAVGAASVTVAQSLSGWQRGGARFVVASLAHPTPALLVGILGLAEGGDPLQWYVAGATLAAATQAVASRADLARPAGPLAAVVELARTAPLGAAGLANQAILVAVPVVLLHQGRPEAATVLALALGAYRPLSILQFGLNFTVGPTVAGPGDRPIDARQRVVLDRAAGLQQLALVPYALVGGAVMAAVGAGLLTGHPLPTLLWCWLVLLAGHAVALGTGPTGQLLMMRGNERATVRAALAGLVGAVVWFALPLAPWLRAAGAISASLAVQNAMTAHLAWICDRWLARPGTVLPSALREVARMAARMATAGPPPVGRR